MAHIDPSDNAVAVDGDGGSDSTDAPDAADAAEEVAQQSGAVYRFGRFVVGPLARLIWRPRITGRSGVPKKGPLIFASNHQSFIDSIVIPMLAPRRVQFIAKASYFEGKGVSGWFQRVFFGSVGAVPIQRGVGAAAQEALEQSRRIIESGNALALYPEGTRSLDGRLYKGRTGVAWLVLETGARVVPVGLSDTAKLMPVGAKVPRLARVSVAFGEPLDFSHLGGANTGRNRREVTDEIMRSIQALTGQEFVDAYNEAPPATRTERVRRLFRNERSKPTLPLD